MASSSTSDPGAAGKQPLAAAVKPGPKAEHAAAKPLGRPSFFDLRREIPRWQSVFFGLACIALCAAIWWFLTSGKDVESRLLSSTILPSPAETFGSFHSLWFERALTRQAYASLKRVTLGFGLATLVGVPLGVLCGCFPWINSFFAPLTIMGRNIPVAALIPLTFSLFGIGEFQKIMFIFVACVAFIVMDSATAVADVSSRYIDTAYTLGANRRQIILKVLVPLALPNIFNSLRVLFGLAFGYIMLAELVKLGNESGGLGDVINMSLRRGLQTHILLVLMIIPLVALAIDRLLFWVQRELFPHQYGGMGILNRGVKVIVRSWEDLKSVFVKPAEYAKSSAPGASK
ncbi:MAG: ABC transporter permease [Pirellulales bacterium]